MATNADSLLISLRAKIKRGSYRFTVHCLERRIERNISRVEIEEAIQQGKIIEHYPEDKYSPSCLIMGFTAQDRPIHVHCSIDPVWIITCYDPSERPQDWDSSYAEEVKMKCSACRGEMVQKTGDLDLRVNDDLYIVRNVPFEQCTNCGEKVLNPETSEVIYTRIHSQDFTKVKVVVSSIDLAANS